VVAVVAGEPVDSVVLAEPVVSPVVAVVAVGRR
jgi:hypothetical protein